MGLDRIQSFLVNKHIKVPEDWIEQCLEYIRTEINPTMPFNELAENVLQQYLTADLAVMELPVLPACLTKANRFFLNGNYCVQMNSIFDSSVSSYSQLQRITNAENENTEVTAEEEAKKPWEQQKSKRMLVLELTDGVINIRGMEYQSIPVLNADLPPGTKILLSGRIESRKGMLMLTAENVSVMGGYVEGLTDENSQKNFLTRRINANRKDGDGQGQRRQEPPIQEQRRTSRAVSEVQFADQDQKRAVRQVSPVQFADHRKSNNQSSGLHIQRNPPKIIPVQKQPTWSEMEEEIPSSSNVRQPSFRVKDDDDDVVLLSDSEDGILLQALDEVTRDNFETSHNYPSRSKDKPKFDAGHSKSMQFYEPPTKKDRSDDNFNDFHFDNDWNFNDQNSELLVDNELIPMSVIEDNSIDDLLTNTDHSPLARVIGFVSSSANENEFEITYEPTRGVDLILRRKNKSVNQTKASFGLTRLCDLIPKDSSNLVNSRLCTVKAAIIHTISHLNSNNGERWSYSAKITDGTAVVDCQICDEVLTELIEMTAAEAMAIRNSSIESAKLKAVELVKKTANFVQSFNGLMQVETKFQNLAVVRKMKPLDDLEIKQLENLFLSR